jgi:hypothetical protein
MRHFPQQFCTAVATQESIQIAWSAYHNFSTMYNDVYRLWIAAGVAKQLPEPVWMDGGGQIVKTENEAIGLMVDVDLLFPDKVIVGWTMEQSRPRSK